MGHHSWGVSVAKLSGVGIFVRVFTLPALPLEAMEGKMMWPSKSVPVAPMVAFQLDIVSCKRGKSSFMLTTCAEGAESKARTSSI